MNARPSLLFYCQHSLGMGHLVRSLALAEGLAARFRVVLLNGGRLPRGVRVPHGVEVTNLPPLGFDDNNRLVSRDGRRSLERAQQIRQSVLLHTFHSLQPQVLLIEMFPFGRKKFANELLPLLEAAQAAPFGRPVVACSVRDILVTNRADQQRHDQRAAELANRYFAAVLLHADAKFIQLQESFGSLNALRIPVHYTGFVCPGPCAEPVVDQPRFRQVVVSAGGGLVGEPLLRTAIEAFPLLRRSDPVEMKVVAGPFLPERAWCSLRAAVRKHSGLQVRRYVPDLLGEMRQSAASVSQCGYNTFLDILRSGVPALVVPFGEGIEDEQRRRATLLERLGALRVLDSKELTAARLAEEIHSLLRFEPQPLYLNLNGARRTASLLEDLLSAGTRREPQVADAATLVPEICT